MRKEWSEAEPRKARFFCGVLRRKKMRPNLKTEFKGLIASRYRNLYAAEFSARKTLPE
jgi:hypothetical protein